MPLAAAVAAPRLHMEESFLNLESGLEGPAQSAALEECSAHKLWPGRNLFFGGVHAATRGQGAGDARRGGVAISV